jgi:hypothetical protein
MSDMQRRREEAEWEEGLWAAEDKHTDDFTNGFDRAIGRQVLKLVKEIGVADKKKFYRDGEMASYTVTNLHSVTHDFADAEGNNYTLQAATSRQREHWQRSPLPPYFLRPHTGRRVIEAEIMFAVPGQTREYGGPLDAIASLDAMDYADALWEYSGSSRPSQRYALHRFSAFLALAQSVAQEGHIPQKAAVDAVLHLGSSSPLDS